MYSQEGLSCPLGISYPPSGRERAICYGVYKNMVRSLSLFVCRLMTGGNDRVFNKATSDYATSSILTSTKPGVQLYLLKYLGV